MAIAQRSLYIQCELSMLHPILENEKNVWNSLGLVSKLSQRRSQCIGAGPPKSTANNFKRCMHGCRCPQQKASDSCCQLSKIRHDCFLIEILLFLWDQTTHTLSACMMHNILIDLAKYLDPWPAANILTLCNDIYSYLFVSRCKMMDDVYCTRRKR